MNQNLLEKLRCEGCKEEVNWVVGAIFFDPWRSCVCYAKVIVGRKLEVKEVATEFSRVAAFYF